jgi:MFS family permease
MSGPIAPDRASSRLPVWPFLLAVLLFAAVQAFYLGLSLAALDKLEADAERLREDSVLDVQAGRLTTVAALGLAPDSYMGLGAEVRRAAARSGAEAAAFVGPDGRVVAGLGVEGFLGFPADPAAGDRTLAFESGGRRWRALAVAAADGRLWGLICVSPHDRPLRGRAADLAATAVGPAGLAALIVSAGLTGLAMVFGSRRHASGRLGRRGLQGLVLVPFLLGQIVFTLNSYPDLSRRHQRAWRLQAGQALGNLAIDLGRLISSGVDLARVGDLRRHLDGIRRVVPEAEALAVRSPGFDLVSPPQAARPPGHLVVATALAGGGAVEAWLSPAALRSARIELALDNLFLTMVTVLALMEMTRFLAGAPAPGPGTASGAGPAAPVFRLERLRLVIFATIACDTLPLAIIPLKMSAITGASGGLIPREVLLGLPVAAYSLLTGLGYLVSGRLGTGRRLGRLVTVGLAVGAAGALLAREAALPMVFVVALGLCGLGLGLLNLPYSLIASAALGPERRGEAFSDIASSFFAGGTCGCLVGGLLADRFGMDLVFGLAAVILAGLAVSWRLLAPIPPAFYDAFPERSGGPGPVAGLRVLLGRRRPLALVFLSLLPLYASLVGLINYYLPLRLQELGYGPAVAGRLNFMMSMMIIVLAPAVGRAIDRSGRTVPWLVGAGLAAGASSVSFLALPSVWGAVLAMAWLGLAIAVSESGLSTALMGLPEAQEIGPNNALGLFAVMGRLFQTSGPVLLGAALGLWGAWGLAVFGGAAAAMSVAYGSISDPGPGRGPEGAA